MTTTWEERGNRRHWRCGDRCYVRIGAKSIAGLVLASAPPSDGIMGMAKIKVALPGPESRWFVFGVYGRPMPFLYLSERVEEIVGLDSKGDH